MGTLRVPNFMSLCSPWPEIWGKNPAPPYLDLVYFDVRLVHADIYFAASSALSYQPIVNRPPPYDSPGLGRNEREGHFSLGGTVRGLGAPKCTFCRFLTFDGL